MLQVLAAARDPNRKPVKIFGEPGLEKDNIAALLHFGSADRNKPMVKVRAR
jgi:transcriptional regulator with AAA-type ATPase domain